MKTRLVLLLGLLALALAACGGGGDERRAASIPDTPVGTQLAWLLDQLNGDAATLDATGVRAHFTPQFLATMPAAELVATLRRDAAQRSPVAFTRFVGRRTSTAAIALVTARGGERAAAYVDVEASPPHRITSLQIDEPPAPSARGLATPGAHTGSFDVGGRRLFLTCAGTGEPTVVLEAGLGGGAAAWTKVQGRLARLTRVCSYDRANVPGGAGDPAPKPRTAQDVVDDLEELLRAAGVPGPYVLAGHSFGGLTARLYASEHPEQVAGLVLVDSMHEDQLRRSTELALSFVPAAQRRAARQAAARPEPPFVATIGDEGIDERASLAQMRAARSATALRPLPLVVLAHGKAEPTEGMPPRYAAASERMWRELQAELARLVPQGRLVVATRSGHQINQDQPGLVVDAVRDVVIAARNQRGETNDS